jgi:anti-sigma B factor antagonist
MTAVTGMSGSGVQLICDGCGHVATADGGGLHDADIVYVAVSTIGWSGSAFARGPHRCPACSSAAPAVRHPANRPAARVAGRGRVSVRTAPTASVVHIAGDIDTDVVGELRSALETALRARPYVIADLTQAGTIDSFGLGTLVRARNAARRRHGELLLAGPSRFVQTVLHTMRLHTAFRMFTTVAQAMAATDRVNGHTGVPARRRPAPWKS